MSDYNDGLLPEPCLRMDTHFCDEYESVEFGDGTGYVKAEPTLARLGALYVELDVLHDENAKLREVARLVSEYISHDRCEGCVVKTACNSYELDECWMTTKLRNQLRELGVEVDE